MSIFLKCLLEISQLKTAFAYRTKGAFVLQMTSVLRGVKAISLLPIDGSRWMIVRLGTPIYKTELSSNLSGLLCVCNTEISTYISGWL